MTPFAWASARWSLGSRALRWSTTAALVVSVLIVLGGGVVRVTGSGLGCPTWPTCDGSSLTPIPELGIHGLIEFGNRTVTGLLIVAVGWAIISARLQKPWDRTLSRLAWSMFWLVVVNAVAGGITVLVKLNPWVVALHFVLAMALLATATLTWHRARERGATATPGSRRVAAVRGPAARWSRAIGWAVVISAAALVVVGTIVSGAGPHSGDSRDVPRIPVDWTGAAWVHGALAALTLVLAVVAIAGVPAARPRAIALLVVLLLQGAIGLVQAVTGLPELMVALHLLGAALVWIGAVRVLLDADPALFALRTTTSVEPATAPVAR